MAPIATPSGDIIVTSFLDPTPGDEYAAVSLQLGSVQVDLSPAEVCDLVSQLSGKLREVTTPTAAA